MAAGAEAREEADEGGPAGEGGQEGSGQSFNEIVYGVHYLIIIFLFNFYLFFSNSNNLWGALFNYFI
jgi:hypothetical protein